MDFESPRNCLGNAVRKASRVVTSHYEEALRPTGLRFTQFSGLYAIRAMNGPTISALAWETEIDRTTLTRTLGLLERRGLCTLAAGSDKRERHVSLTGEGERALDAARGAWNEAQQTLLSRMEGENAQELLSTLGRLATAAKDATGKTDY